MAKEKDSRQAAPKERGLDVVRLRADVSGLSANDARKLRRQQAMPVEFQPPLDGLALLHQIMLVWNTFGVWGLVREPAEDNRQDADRVTRVHRIYLDLARAGYALKNVNSLRKAHAEAVLAYWRKQGRQIRTICTDWSILRTWVRALGKQGMLGELKQHWPDAPKPGPAPRRSAEQRREALHGDPAVLTELLRGRDQTHWFVERMCYELGVTAEQALRFKPAQSCDLHQKAEFRTGDSGVVKVVVLDTDAKRQLIEEVVAYILERGRKVLAWQDMNGAQALRRHQQRMCYVRKKVRRADSTPADAGDRSGPGCVAQTADGDETARENVGGAAQAAAAEAA